MLFCQDFPWWFSEPTPHTLSLSFSESQYIFFWAHFSYSRLLPTHYSAVTSSLNSTVWATNAPPDGKQSALHLANQLSPSNPANHLPVLSKSAFPVTLLPGFLVVFLARTGVARVMHTIPARELASFPNSTARIMTLFQLECSPPPNRPIRSGMAPPLSSLRRKWLCITARESKSVSFVCVESGIGEA